MSGDILDDVPTLIPDPAPPELEALKERRRRWGADTHDEVWEGVHRIIPAPGEAHWLVAQQLAELMGPLGRGAGLVPSTEFNLGQPDDYRVPDGGLHDPSERGDWRSTAALVVEILSPADETWKKLPFHAAHEVDEVLIVDPGKRSVHWLARSGDGYREVERSGLIDLGPERLAEQIDWPASG